MQLSLPRSAVLVALACSAILLTNPAAGTILHVEADGSGDYLTIQAAMDAAVSGDTVLLGPGTYTDSVTRLLNGLNARAVAFLKSGVVLEGAYGADVTIIDGEFSRHCLVGEDLAGGTAVRGTTLWRGESAGSAGNQIWGGGLLVYDSGLLVEMCTFRDCRAVGGGGALFWGIHSSGFGREVAGPVVRHCLFETNSADDLGGAIEIYDTPEFLLENNTFVSNQADDRGGAILINSATGDMDRNVFWYNNAGQGGGAIGCIGGAGPFAHGACNVFWGNTAPIGSQVEGCTVIPGQDGNVVDDPLFCDAATHDFRLQADSPAAPPQSGSCGLIGAFPVNCGTGGSSGDTVVLPRILADAGTEVAAPIAIRGFPPFEATSFLAEIHFDPAVAAYTRYEKTGTLAEDLLIMAHEVAPGVLRVAGAGTERIGTDADLLRLFFLVDGSAASGTHSPLHFELFEWNEGLPVEEVVHGGITVAPGLTVSGNVSYYSNQQPVAGADLTIDGDAFQSSSTDPLGDYATGELWYGSSVSIHPSHGDPSTDAISAMDASFVLRHVVGWFVLDPEQQIAADVSGDGTVSPLDASGILDIVVHDPDAIPDPLWAFAPDVIEVASLPGDLPDQDFRAILRGDVTGNWCPGTPCPDGGGRAVFAWSAGGDWTTNRLDFVVRVEDAGALGVDFTVSWREEDLELTEVTYPGAGLWASHGSAGAIGIAGASAGGFAAGEAEVVLTFRAMRSPRPASEIHVEALRVDESLPEDRTVAIPGVSRPTSGQPEFDLAVSPVPARGPVRLGITGAPGAVQVDIFDVSGRRIRGLGASPGPDGSASITWDRRDDEGVRIASGIFFARLRSKDRVTTRRIVLVR